MIKMKYKLKFTVIITCLPVLALFMSSNWQSSSASVSKYPMARPPVFNNHIVQRFYLNGALHKIIMGNRSEVDHRHDIRLSLPDITLFSPSQMIDWHFQANLALLNQNSQEINLQKNVIITEGNSITHRKLSTESLLINLTNKAADTKATVFFSQHGEHGTSQGMHANLLTKEIKLSSAASYAINLPPINK